MLNNTTEVTTDTLVNEVAARLPQGYRFVTMTCCDLGDAFDIIYHFDKDYVLYNLRLKLAKGQELPSISGIYLAALVVENEIKDLFGVPVKGLVIDYDGKFMICDDAPRAPMCKAAASAPAVGEKEGA